ncbi:MAG: DNA primase [Ignavibacteriales bacterium]|nr:DNA primase [Ignavibacteriales bacterium]
MRIPEDTIQSVRNATDIVEYVGNFVPLKKRGKSYLGICPFHLEKTPSFNVSAEKQMYYCFGCGKGGDVIKFVMERERLSYVEAIEILAERAGIVIQRVEDRDTSSNELESLYAACTFAARFFHQQLTKTEEGKFALDYFRSRAFSEQIITTFGLGYSPRSWDALVKRAAEEGIDPVTLDRVGLCRKREDGSLYDAFRGRAMFPVFTPTGRVIAFGARKLYDDDNLGKYINSPETTIYHKSKVLYGLFQARESIREKNGVVLVEGYADLISVYQAGTKNIVASSGTALTTEQIQLISRYTKNVLLVYDADSAGIAAMMRGVDLILENGLDVRVLQLPEGEDPDSFVRKEGGEAFSEAMGHAVTFIDFKAAMFQREGKLDSPEGRSEAVRSLVQTIAKIKDEIKRSFFIKDVAEKYGLYESMLYSELEKYGRPVPEKFLAAVEPARQPESAPLPDPPKEVPLAERELLTVLLEEPAELIPFVFRYVQPEEFSHPAARSIAELLLASFEESGSIDIHVLSAAVAKEDERRLLHDLTFNKHQLSARWLAVGARLSDTRLLEIAEGCIKQMKRRALEVAIEQNQRELKDAAMKGRDASDYLRRHQDLLVKLKSIDKIILAKS